MDHIVFICSSANDSWVVSTFGLFWAILLRNVYKDLSPCFHSFWRIPGSGTAESHGHPMGRFLRISKVFPRQQCCWTFPQCPSIPLSPHSHGCLFSFYYYCHSSGFVVYISLMISEITSVHEKMLNITNHIPYFMWIHLFPPNIPKNLHSVTFNSHDLRCSFCSVNLCA